MVKAAAPRRRASCFSWPNRKSHRKAMSTHLLIKANQANKKHPSGGRIGSDWSTLAESGFPVSPSKQPPRIAACSPHQPIDGAPPLIFIAHR